MFEFGEGFFAVVVPFEAFVCSKQLVKGETFVSGSGDEPVECGDAAG